MAKNNNLTDFVTDIANTIRSKDGTTANIDPQDFSSRIINYQQKTVNPSTSAQTIVADSGYMALSSVKVNAMSSATVTPSVETPGIGTYFTVSTSTDTSISIIPQYTNTAGYIDEHSSPQTGDVRYYKIKPGTIGVTDLEITPNALLGVWDATNNKYVVSQASKTATMHLNITTSGWVSPTIGTKNTGTATVKAPSNLEIPKATFEVSGASIKTTSSGAGYIPASTIVGTIPNAEVVNYINTEGMNTYFTTGTESSHDVAVQGGHGVTYSGYVSIHSPTYNSIFYKIKAGSVTLSNVTVNATISNPTYDATNDVFTLSVSGSATITPATTAGWVTSVSTKTATANGSKTLSVIEIDVDFNGTTKVTPVISNISSTVSGKTQIIANPSTSSSGIGTYYMAVYTAPKSNTLNIFSTITGDGYGTSEHGVHNDIDVAVGSNNSGTYYIPITSGAITNSLSYSLTITDYVAVSTSESSSYDFSISTGATINTNGWIGAASQVSNVTRYFRPKHRVFTFTSNNRIISGNSGQSQTFSIPFLSTVSYNIYVLIGGYGVSNVGDVTVAGDTVNGSVIMAVYNKTVSSATISATNGISVNGIGSYTAGTVYVDFVISATSLKLTGRGSGLANAYQGAAYLDVKKIIIEEVS